MISSRRSFITGIKSIKLSSKERSFLKKFKPWGVILFLRNIKSINQVYNLTKEIRNLNRKVSLMKTEINRTVIIRP